MSVTIEQHKQMTEKGIYERKDGKFGFKRKCKNEDCDTFIEKCFCSDSLNQSLINVEKRSETHCSVKCAVENDTYFSNIVWEIISDYANSKYHTPLQTRLQQIVLDTLGIKILDIVSKGKWMLEIKDKDYTLYDILMDELQEETSNWDSDESEDGECGCEI